MSLPQPFVTLGTTSTPYYIPLAGSPPETTRTAQGYFAIHLVAAQAAFTAGFFQSARQLIVTTQVNLHLADQHPLGDQALAGLVAYRELQKNTATWLGFSPMLVDFVPATMQHVSLSVEYLVDVENRLAQLASVIESQDLLAVVSLAPGPAMAAKVVTKLVGKLIDTFIPQQVRKPILQFSGDFDLASAEGLREGYYVILGAHDKRNPLPTVTPRLAIAEGGQLLMDGKPLTQLSYVVLKVTCLQAIRDRFMGPSPWRTKLAQAKDAARDYSMNVSPEADAAARRAEWQKNCLVLLREARALLQSDPNFLPSEVELAYWAAYQECQDLVMNTKSARGSGLAPAWTPNADADRAFLGLPQGEALGASLDDYAEKLMAARTKLAGEVS